MIAVGEWERRMSMVGRALHQLKDRKSPGGPDCQSVLIVGAILFGSIALAGSLLYAGHVVFLLTSPHLLPTWEGVALLGLLLLVGAASILARLGLPHIGGHVLAGGVLVGVVVISIWVGAMPGVVLHHLTVAAIAVTLFNLRVGVIYAAASTAAFLLATGLERAFSGIPILEALPEGAFSFVFSPFTALLTISLLILYSACAVQNARLYQSLAEAHEELKKADRQRTEYYSLVIHDMRSPLTVALGFIEMLLEPMQDETLAESQRFMLGQTQEAIDRVLTMVNDFLDYSKIEAGYLRLEKKAIDLGELVDKTIEELRAMAASKGVNLAWKAPSPALFVQGDGRRLQQVVENLLVNAFKYTDESGTVEVRIGQEGDQVRVEVQDTGIGIPPEAQPPLFDAYHAIAGGRLSRHMRGTGLGLFIVKRIVEAHGGSVGLHSTGVPGEGSTFYFTLPLAAEED
jgi:signal transduction histidine kinase